MLAWMQRYIVYLFPFLTIILIVYYMYRYVTLTARPRSILDLIGESKTKKSFNFPRVFRLEKLDIIPILAITLCYGLVAFWNLGINQNPQTFTGSRGVT